MFYVLNFADEQQNNYHPALVFYSGLVPRWGF